MLKLIICVKGNPAVQGYKRRNFLWSVTHKLYIHEGKEYSPEEFNAVIEKAVRDRYDMRPFVKAIVTPDAPPATAPSTDLVAEAQIRDAQIRTLEKRIEDLQAQLDVPPAPIAPPAPFPARVSVRGEPTLAEAEDVMQRLAPHRLKGKTGPKATVVC